MMHHPNGKRLKLECYSEEISCLNQKLEHETYSTLVLARTPLNVGVRNFRFFFESCKKNFFIFVFKSWEKNFFIFEIWVRNFLFCIWKVGKRMKISIVFFIKKFVLKIFCFWSHSFLFVQKITKINHILHKESIIFCIKNQSFFCF